MKEFVNPIDLFCWRF